VSALMSAVALVGVGAAVASSTTTIRSTNNVKYGRMLVGPARYSLYVFAKGTSSVGSAHSSPNWPPEIASGRVVAAKGSQVKQSKLGTRKLSNGKHQVTYYGQPLYLYKGDKRPGQTKGEDKFSGQGAWFLVSTTGRPIQPPGY
jgi:predicted lipoprotein with Yx(FWY)xxD motif